MAPGEPDRDQMGHEVIVIGHGCPGLRRYTVDRDIGQTLDSHHTATRTGASFVLGHPCKVVLRLNNLGQSLQVLLGELPLEEDVDFVQGRVAPNQVDQLGDTHIPVILLQDFHQVQQ